MPIANPVLTFDTEGNLERVHCQPEERCQLDDSTTRKTVTWADAIVAIPTACSQREIEEMLCDYCFGGEA